jgi:hypothetical protein
MARPKNNSGHWTVENAEQLFVKSVADGKPDFRFVALAIGSAPVSPPRWAVWACIEERDRELRKPPSTSAEAQKINVVLNELVRFLYRNQEQREADPASRDLSPPSLRSAIIEVFGLLHYKVENGGNDDWLQPYRRAWKIEQKQDKCSSVYRLDGFEMTIRIDRELHAYIGELEGYPSDIVSALWMTNELQKLRDDT